MTKAVGLSKIILFIVYFSSMERVYAVHDVWNKLKKQDIQYGNGKVIYTKL